MNIQYHKWRSQCLCRDMEYKIYGDSGRPILVIPTQDGRFFDWENRRMIGIMSHWIETGQCRVICCDAIDAETWSAKGGDGGHRAWLQEQWFHYITDELIPSVRYAEWETFYTIGCSLGATHALNFCLRRPDIFKGCIAMSGLYQADFFFDGYRDNNVYNNSPVDYISNMPWDHHYMDLYRQSRMILTNAQGRWEAECLESTRQMQQIFHAKGIPAHVLYWGTEWDHDWPTWEVMVPLYLEELLNWGSLPNTCYW